MTTGKWLNRCRKCGIEFWGIDSDKGYCVSCRGTNTAIFECECGCGNSFERPSNINPAYAKKYFNRECQMRARRRTVNGKAYIEEYNKRYKRVEREWECGFPLCGRRFKSARKRKYCDEHSR